MYTNYFQNLLNELHQGLYCLLNPFEANGKFRRHNFILSLIKINLTWPTRERSLSCEGVGRAEVDTRCKHFCTLDTLFLLYISLLHTSLVFTGLN